MTEPAELTTDLTTPHRNVLRAWWPAAVWIGIITIESTDTFSSQNTGGMLYQFLTRLFGNINLYDFLVFHHYLRKTGHVIGYGMLSVLLLRGWRASFGCARAMLLRAALLAGLGTVCIAALDEWHQSYIPSRTGTIWDVGLDTLAGVIFLLIAFVWLLRVDPFHKKVVPELLHKY